jgi:hypothetical protein
MNFILRIVFTTFVGFSGFIAPKVNADSPKAMTEISQVMTAEISPTSELAAKLNHDGNPFLVATGWTPATSGTEQLQQLQQMTAPDVGMRPLDNGIVIVFNSGDEAAIKEAATLAEQLPAGTRPTLIGINPDQAGSIANLGIEAPNSKKTQSSGWSFFPKVSKPTDLERSTAWFMASFRLATLMPMLIVGLKAPFALSSVAGYGIAALMVGRTWWRAQYIDFFDALYTGRQGTERTFSKWFERTLRYGADLVFFEALGVLTALKTGEPSSQIKILTLWAVQSSLGNLFQVNRSSVYKIDSQMSAEQQNTIRSHSATANLNTWMLVAPFPLLDLFGLTPTLFTILDVNLTGAHLGLAIVSIGSSLAIKTKWYNSLLEVQQKWGVKAANATSSLRRIAFNIPRSICGITSALISRNNTTNNPVTMVKQREE